MKKQLWRTHHTTLVLLVGLLLILTALIGIKQRADAPSPNTPAKTHLSNGQQVTIKGIAVCLPHKNTSQIETQMCAYGLLSEGVYYGLADSKQDFSLIMKIQSSKQVEVTGIYTSSPNSDYLDSGVITITSVKD